MKAEAEQVKRKYGKNYEKFVPVLSRPSIEVVEKMKGTKERIDTAMKIKNVKKGLKKYKSGRLGKKRSSGPPTPPTTPRSASDNECEDCPQYTFKAAGGLLRAMEADRVIWEAEEIRVDTDEALYPVNTEVYVDDGTAAEEEPDSAGIFFLKNFRLVQNNTYTREQ